MPPEDRGRQELYETDEMVFPPHERQDHFRMTSIHLVYQFRGQDDAGASAERSDCRRNADQEHQQPGALGEATPTAEPLDRFAELTRYLLPMTQ